MNKDKTKPAIPTRIRVGRKWYSVEVVEAMLERRHMGKTYYPEQQIKVGKRSNITGKPYKECDIRDSFWHEVTHAILFDMGRDRLNADEQFVTEFANRLSKAIDSARFK